MKVVITGASGFVGSYMVRHFLDRGDAVTGLGRSGSHPEMDQHGFTWIRSDTTIPGDWQRSIEQADVVVNLAGANIFKRWNEAYKEKILKSRVLTTQNVVDGISKDKKTVLISTSAIGFYGDRGEETLVETSDPGDDFLARVCVEWESAAADATLKGARVVILRFGVVLGKDGGALGKMVPAFKGLLGGPLGRGDHWFPWVHIRDIARAMDFCLKNQEMEGPLNMCGPGAVRQRDFAASLGRALNRPAFMPAPSWAIRLIMGEMADAILASARAVPEGLVKAGFEFEFPGIDQALDDIVG
ncbi:MAG: TIGR01777 family oxidoreductase [Desulfobacterium sp.]|jgi:uncharacterized protein (TIGR01777 family)|nr:TIGR01777 family oxidoreductase [Desulfobacterium sp.]